MFYKSKSVRKDDKNVSFVGLHNTNQGIIAFADSKATLKFENNVITEDKERGIIPKLFKNNKFIFVTYGSNEIFSEKNITKIEDYIFENLKMDMDYKSFFIKLNSDIQNDWDDYNNGEYNFIIGSKDENGKYYLVRCLIKRGEKISFYDKTYEKNVYYGGDKFYCLAYNAQQHYKNIDIIDYTKMIKEFIENLVKCKDCFSSIEYNSVGLPINTEIFQ